MMSRNNGLLKFLAGVGIGVGAGMLLAPKKGEELRKELMEKINELLNKAKEIDVKEVADDFKKKASELKKEIEDLDKEKALDIAKTKSDIYSVQTLKKLEKQLYDEIDTDLSQGDDYVNANERIKYWFDEDNYKKLSAIKRSIYQIPNNKYRRAFLCIFSSILKASSKWLTKSIKPQIDPEKSPVDPIVTFKSSASKFISIVEKEQKNSGRAIHSPTAD